MGSGEENAPEAVLDASHATEMDRTMMRRALELAQQAAAAGEAPIGAVIYDAANSKTLAEAHNMRETEKDPLGHAELITIRRAARAIGDWRLNHCTLVVTLEPCPMCAGAIVNARVGRLVYGARDPKAGACESLFQLCSDARLNHRITPIAGVFEEDASELLREFFQARRQSKNEN